jgi:chromosome segregation ATPase
MTATDHEPDRENLTSWEATLSRQAEDLRGEIGAKQAELSGVEERLKLVRRLLELEAHGTPSNRRSDGKASASKALATKPPELEQAVTQILRDAGKPLHIADIRAELIDRQVPIPGRGDDANIIVRLRRLDEQFTRTGRGTYALAEWGLEPLASARRRRRPRKASQ